MRRAPRTRLTPRCGRVAGTQALARQAKRLSSVVDVPKLEDAELAATSRAAECTLIVTEGDSAKALAVAGLEVVGRRTYGVFPLRGKPLNVRDVSMKKVGENEELKNLMRALGLKPGTSYGEPSDHAELAELADAPKPNASKLTVAALKAELASRGLAVGGVKADLAARLSEAAPDAFGTAVAQPGGAAQPRSPARRGGSSGRDTLRYGRLMLMADQDADGSHIKGLVISMLHHFWPELLRHNYVQARPPYAQGGARAPSRPGCLLWQPTPPARPSPPRQEFNTPLLKARRLGDGQVAAFFNLRDYEGWRAQVGEVELNKWRTK